MAIPKLDETDNFELSLEDGVRVVAAKQKNCCHNGTQWKVRVSPAGCRHFTQAQATFQRVQDEADLWERIARLVEIVRAEPDVY